MVEIAGAFANSGGVMNSDFLIARRVLMAIVAISYVSVFMLAEIVGFKIDYAQIAQFVGYFLIVAVAAHFIAHTENLAAWPRSLTPWHAVCC